MKRADAADAAGAAEGANPFRLQEELRMAKRKIARFEEENEILLKASAFFASKQL